MMKTRGEDNVVFMFAFFSCKSIQHVHINDRFSIESYSNSEIYY